jgi:hypothetical protein
MTGWPGHSQGLAPCDHPKIDQRDVRGFFKSLLGSGADCGATIYCFGRASFGILSGTDRESNLAAANNLNSSAYGETDSPGTGHPADPG